MFAIFSDCIITSSWYDDYQKEHGEGDKDIVFSFCHLHCKSQEIER